METMSVGQILASAAVILAVGCVWALLFHGWPTIIVHKKCNCDKKKE
jgi:hypothetical protein